MKPRSRIRLAARGLPGSPRSALGFAVTVLVGACATEPRLPVPATITVFPDSPTLLWVGDTVQLTATVWDVDGSGIVGVPVTWWMSEDESVVTVDSAGLVTAVGKGVASVWAATGNVTGSSSVTVNPDRRALLEIHEALGGSGWRMDDNWGTDAPLDEWYGVTTDSEGNVQALNLAGNGLSGTIPPAIGHLEALDTLNLCWNDLTGIIPPELGNLRQLRVLSLCRNDIIGPIPPELGNLQALEGLHLNDNNIIGPIPPEFGNLRKLVGLSLSSNRAWRLHPVRTRLPHGTRIPGSGRQPFDRPDPGRVWEPAGTADAVLVLQPAWPRHPAPSSATSRNLDTWICIGTP